MTDANLPHHIALIPDGNRRWSRERGLPTFEGHRRGMNAMTAVIEEAWKLGVTCFTAWGFSTENWDRKEKEISYLMELFVHVVDYNLKSAKEHEARLIHLGRKDRIPRKLVDKIHQAEEETSKFTKHTLAIGLDYGGRDEIVRAVSKLLTDKSTDTITPQDFEKYLDTRDVPYPSPDLIIRTGGEQRLSGFLSWQSAYSELAFEPKKLPDFTPEDLRRHVENFQQRQRRFGK